MKFFSITYISILRKETTIRLCNLKADDMVDAIRQFEDEKGSDYEILSIAVYGR
jgi:hypothetical protein